MELCSKVKSMKNIILDEMDLCVYEKNKTCILKGCDGYGNIRLKKKIGKRTHFSPSLCPDYLPSYRTD